MLSSETYGHMSLAQDSTYILLPLDQVLYFGKLSRAVQLRLFPCQLHHDGVSGVGGYGTKGKIRPHSGCHILQLELGCK
jgi:hypothetical protein